MANPRGTRAYRQAVNNLKAEGDTQCWRCGKTLYAHLTWPHKQSITLGHLLALEDGGHPTDRGNHRAECITCNMGDGAKRTNAKRSGRGQGTSYRNPNY